MPLPVATPTVKRRLERPAGRDKRESKNNSSADIARAQAEAILNLFPARNDNDQTRYKPCFLDFSSLAA